MKHVDSLTMKELSSIPIKIIKTNRKVEYLNIESGFDIETSSVTFPDGTKSAFMYIWAFGIGEENEIIYGRTWEQFHDLCKKLQRVYKLSKEKRLVVYIHNFSYEFQFMRKYFDWEEGQVFAVGERKPIKALTTMGIEFRDSYILSGYSLAKTAENLIYHDVKKMEGDLDYKLIRTEKTPLTEKEMMYLNNDVEIILAYINEEIEQNGDITKIPMTNTGKVRNYVRNNCYHTGKNHRKNKGGKYSKYRKIMNDLTLTPESYLQAKKAYSGGFTHANPLYVNHQLENVSSIDFTSSYPSVMLAERYPMSRPKKLTSVNMDRIVHIIQNPLQNAIFTIKVTNIESIIPQDYYISRSKCNERTLKNPNEFNGRIQSADYLETTITDIDLSVILNCYKWENIEIVNVFLFHSNFLPKPIIESVLKLYSDKTQLKGVEGKEVEYLHSKGMINSVYGMMVTDIVKDVNEYSDEWQSIKIADLPEQQFMEKMNEMISDYNESKNRFLYYPWGIFITAYARRNLWTGILAFGLDYVYSDTDSIKCLNYEEHTDYINWYNNDIIHKMENMCDFYKIDKTLLKPKTKDGKEKMIGVWDFEGTYTKFKTLGAKRYMVEQDGKIEITVAGLSKQNGVEYLLKVNNNDNQKVFDMFQNNMYIPKDETGKMTHTYIDSEMSYTIHDFNGVSCDINTKSCIHLEECEFTLSLSDNVLNTLSQLEKGYFDKGVKLL